MTKDKKTSTSEYDEKMRKLNMAKAGIEKQFGEGSVFIGSDAPRVEVDVISTRNFALDLALGVGGLPRGRIVEIFGPEGIGKTLIALTAVGESQANGGVAAYIDAEHALDPSWAQKNGVNWDELLISQPSSGEQALQIARKLLASGAFDIIVVDSVSALTPQAEINGEIGDTHVGLQSRMMSQALRILSPMVGETDTTLIFINQLRERIGPMVSGTTTTSGGRALRFYAGVRIELKHLKQLTDTTTGEITGRIVQAKIIKNKVAPPFTVAEYKLMHGQGFDNNSTLLEMGKKYDLILMSGAFYYSVDENGEKSEKSIGQGEARAITYLKENPLYTEWLKRKITAEYHTRKGYMPVEEIQREEGPMPVRVIEAKDTENQ